MVRSWHFHDSAIAGGCSGVAASIATCPLDVIKTRLQAQIIPAFGQPAYIGLRQTSRRIWVEEGFRGFYRGLGPTILGYLPTWAIYFTVYDSMKIRFGKSYGETSWTSHMLASISAGASSTVLTNPLWVVKTRFMTQLPDIKGVRCREYQDTFQAIRTIYRTEGVRAFYKGLVPSLLGVSHVAVYFPLYEFLKEKSVGDSGDISKSSILMSSSASKMVASLVTYPHEVCRTQLHIQKVKMGFKPISLIAIARRIKIEEGTPGFYKGLSINLLRTVPNSAMTLLTYELVMRQLKKNE